MLGRTKAKRAFFVLFICFIFSVLHKRAQNKKNKQIRNEEEEKLLQISCNGISHLIRGRSCVRRWKWFVTSHDDDVDTQDCLARYGVSSREERCNLLRYLIYVERICPSPPNPTSFFQLHQPLLPYLESDDRILTPNQHLRALYHMLDRCGKVCEFIKTRIEQLEEGWLSTSDVGATSSGEKPRYHVIVHMGLLTRERGLNFGEAALNGGPLGEMVQWADLIAALHRIGHKVSLSYSPQSLATLLGGGATEWNVCNEARRADLVFTDVTGLEQMKSILGSLHHYRCILRVLDVYGSEADFNHPYFNPTKSQHNWGGKGLNLKQFLTHFPHSPDNSFLGFVVPPVNSSQLVQQHNNRALLYGKLASVTHGRKKLKFIETVREYFDDIHSTFHIKSEGDVTPPHVTNHGNMAQVDYHHLMASSRLFVGLEWPLEGPAALEAVSRGLVFLNPRFQPPKGLDEEVGSKPSRRKLDSQHPYMRSIGSVSICFTFIFVLLLVSI